MNVSAFFLTYPGMYVTQAVCHSVIAVIIIESALRVWQIENPVIRQRFRFIVIVLPVLSFPLYQLINPDRGSVFSRLEALFDVNRWLYLELWDRIPLSAFFVLLLIISTFIFLTQEMIPILKHYLEAGNSDLQEQRPEANSAAHEALEQLPGVKPELFIVDDDEVLLFSSTGRDGVVYVSTGLVERLTGGQLQAALAHEIAHISRSKQPSILIVFLMRIVMFFNPIALIEFRRIVQEEEKICDDVSVSLSKQPQALAEALTELYHAGHGLRPFRIKKLSDIKLSLEEFSHNMLIENRIKRLEKGMAYAAGGDWYEFVFTLAVVIAINYFIV